MPPAYLVLPCLGLVALVACAQAPAGDAARRERIEQLAAEYRQEFPEVPVISVEALQAELGEGDLVIVDAREPAERAVSTLPGAISAPELELRAEELAGRRVVTYCTIGYRSSLYARQLRAQGWDARNLEGSILAWTHAGGELHDSRGLPTRRVHVYDDRWNLAADGYEPVW
jgi:sodium/bile acid cotransporter 7